MKTCRKGIHSYEGRQCRECQRMSSDQWKKDNAERYKSYDKARQPYKKEQIKFYRYGVTGEMFQSLKEQQGNKCAVCKSEFDKTPHIDHNHSSGAVRGLLCSSCNRGLGFFKDNVEVLKQAILYLES